MILHPGILALLLGAAISLAMLIGGSLLGIRIARCWRPEQADERQLALERQSWLVATLVQWAIAFETLSLLLFLYTLDDLHPLFVGAMCATGTLNANPVGWHLLWIKAVLFLLGSLWWIANRLDQQSPQAPLTRPKFLALLALLPLATADLVLMTSYFSALKPEIITSCCGSLFGTGSKGVAGELAALPVRPTIMAFYLTTSLFGGMLLACRRWPGRGWRTALALAAAAYGTVASISIVTYISVYYYRLPHHHCPFDLLQGHYHFIGYPLYLCLFGAVLSGLVPQLLSVLRSRPTFAAVNFDSAERRWLNRGVLFLLGMLILASWPLLFGEFSLKAYF